MNDKMSIHTKISLSHMCAMPAYVKVGASVHVPNRNTEPTQSTLSHTRSTTKKQHTIPHNQQHTKQQHATGSVVRCLVK